MLSQWVDAAYPPFLPQAQTARGRGYVACGFYLPNTPRSAALNTWTIPQKQVLDQAGLKAVPIVVPPFDLTTDPIQTAQIAYTTAVQFGLRPTQSVLYSGNHIEQTGGVTGGLWLPIPGNPPTAIGPLSSIQWGSTTIQGWSVDVSSAAPDFPFDKCVVVDFEHATTANPAWYRMFQNEIAVLSTGGYVSSGAIPVEIVGPPTVILGANGRQDVYGTGVDGKIYHKWWDGKQWNGPDIITNPI